MSSVGFGIDTGPTADVGAELHRFIADLYPICRSITGNGVRDTLRRIQQLLPPLVTHEVASGTQVFDWTVPREWNIRDAWIKNLAGDRVVDFRASNLHVVSYSVPVSRRMTVDELRGRLHMLPDRPQWIPYKTSYYSENWGFCVSAEQADALTDAEYDVSIDSTLENGHLSYGELLVPGDTADEVLFSCHICHPSLCNDNLSGVAVAVFLARWLAARARRRLSYRFLFIPGTIGSITWLARNTDRLAAIRHGVVLTGLGAPGPLVYKRSRRGTADIDRIAELVLKQGGEEFAVRDFIPYGYDERQYCSPGIDLPVGCLSRTPYGEYPEYHTSADDLGFVSPETLAGSYRACQEIVGMLEANVTYVNRFPMCEPQLGRRGLYDGMGGAGQRRTREMALLWLLNLADGSHSLLDIAVRSGVAIASLVDAATALVDKGLLEARERTANSAAADIEEITRGDA
jgi:aminopeptidase-like protein